jgi:biotin carboxyl carrier protein
VIAEVETDETKRLIAVAGLDGKYKVVAGATTYIVDVAQVDDGWSLLIAAAPEKSTDSPAVHARRSYDVFFGPESGDERIVYVNRKAVIVKLARQVGGPRAAGRRFGGTVAHAVDAQQGALSVVAPMPGRVVKILVQAGDLVSARQAVAIVEAMKMENEVRAPRAGTIKEVRITQGALVEARAVLVVIE